MNELHLFAGAGGGILGGILLGHRPICAVEINPYARRVLLQRQRDGILPWFPIWDDVTSFDGTTWRGIADVVCGGFPCQDISACGKGSGIEGERSGLWQQMARIVGEVGPRFVFVENSPLLVGRGLGLVLGDLASMGYDARWGSVGAYHSGAPMQGDRLWLVATAKGERLERHGESGEGCRTEAPRRDSAKGIRCSPWTNPAGAICGMAHGVAHRMERTHAIGNGQVPAVARLAWNLLTGDDDMNIANVPGQVSPLAFGMAPAREAEIAGGMTKVPKAWGLAAPARSAYISSSDMPAIRIWERSRPIFNGRFP